ncbi:MAG: hypothetical protein ACXWUC_09560 [Methylosarcina sp.]
MYSIPARKYKVVLSLQVDAGILKLRGCSRLNSVEKVGFLRGRCCIKSEFLHLSRPRRDGIPKRKLKLTSDCFFRFSGKAHCRNWLGFILCFSMRGLLSPLKMPIHPIFE